MISLSESEQNRIDKQNQLADSTKFSPRQQERFKPPKYSKNGKKIGPPTRCTPEFTIALCELLRAGLPLKYSLKNMELDDASYYEWLERGKLGISPYAEFASAVSKCDGDFILSNLAIIKKAASEKQWPAAAWLLERKFSSEFSRNQNRIEFKQKLTATDTVGKIMQLVDQTMDMIASGEITAEDGKALAAVLESHRRVVETIQIKERVDQIEGKLDQAEINTRRTIDAETATVLKHLSHDNDTTADVIESVDSTVIETI